MLSRFKLVTVALLLGIVFLIPAQAVFGADEGKAAYDRGRFEYDDGEYEAALVKFDEALALEPGNPTYMASRGQALLKLGRYDEAEAQFKKLQETGLPDAVRASYIELGALYAETRQYEQSIESYTRAIEANPDRPDLYLARGSMYVNIKDYAAAEADYRRAGELDPKLEAVSYYYLASVSNIQEDLDTTQERLDKAAALVKDPGLAKQIEDFKSAVAKEKRQRKWWGINTTVFFQYDDNVSLEPLDGWNVGPAGTPTSDKEDFSAGLIASFQYYLINKRYTSLGFDYTFRSQIYNELSQNDLIGNGLGAFYSWGSDPWYFRIRTDVTHYLADYEDKMILYTISPTINYVWGDKDRTELMGALEYKDLKDFNDNAAHYAVSLTHFHTIFPPRPEDAIGVTLRVGATVEHEDPEGAMGSYYWSGSPQIGLSFPLPWRLEGDLGFSYTHLKYAQNENFVDPIKERVDNRTTLSAKLGRMMGDFFRADLQWYYTANDSNNWDSRGSDPYEFQRNVFTFVLTGFF